MVVNRFRRVVTGRSLGAAVGCTIVCAMPVFLVGSMAVQIEDSLHFGPGSLGLVVAGYYLGAAVASLPLARLVEAIGALRTMRIACATSAVLLAVIATKSTSWLVLLVLLVPCGVSSAAVQPAANVLLARRVPSEVQGLAFGIKQAAVPTATSLAGLAVPAVALTAGWRWGFGMAAVAAAAMALACPRPTTTLAERQKTRVPVQVPPGDYRPLLILTVGFAIGVASASALAAFVVSSAVSLHISRAVAGLLAGAGGAAAAASRVAAGIRADRRGRAHLRAVALMVTVGSCGYALLGVAALTGVVALFPVAVVITFVAGWGWNGLFNFAIVRNHISYAARATAITQTGGRIAGMVGPFLFGLGVEHGSYSLAWLVTAGLALASAGTMVFGRRLLAKRNGREGSPALLSAQ